jgi:hypothetical protein
MHIFQLVSVRISFSISFFNSFNSNTHHLLLLLLLCIHDIDLTNYLYFKTKVFS